MSISSSESLATLGGGCFWCLEPLFAGLRGVNSVAVGYAGGRTKNPSYEDVCYRNTGHAEVVQISFNPQEISYRELLEIFFTIHNPTTLNRQGADSGTQYRSIILTHDAEQKEVAEGVIREINEGGEWGVPVVTQVAPLDVFYPAEEYHQHYFAKNPWAGYCQAVIHPKVKKFHGQYAERLKS
jgi:peptide-methionine (S)-S-oxide reductase